MCLNSIIEEIFSTYIDRCNPGVPLCRCKSTSPFQKSTVRERWNGGPMRDFIVNVQIPTHRPQHNGMTDWTFTNSTTENSIFTSSDPFKNVSLVFSFHYGYYVRVYLSFFYLLACQKDRRSHFRSRPNNVFHFGYYSPSVGL